MSAEEKWKQDPTVGTNREIHRWVEPGMFELTLKAPVSVHGMFWELTVHLLSRPPVTSLAMAQLESSQSYAKKVALREAKLAAEHSLEVYRRLKCS